MKLNRCTLKVESIAGFRAQALEGEAEGKLGKAFKLKGSVEIHKTKNLFTDKESYERCVEQHFTESGELLTKDLGRFNLGCEGRACKVKVEYGLSDAMEFEDVTLDRIQVELADGRVCTLIARLRLHPKAKDQAKLDSLLKNEVTLTLNGETVEAGYVEETQEELDLPQGEAVEVVDEAEPEPEAMMPALTAPEGGKKKHLAPPALSGPETVQ